MTGPSRGTPRPLRNDTYVPVSSNSSVSPSPERAPAHRPQHQALEHHLRNIVDVEEPSRLMECSQLQRQRQFQYLVRRYISQILHGCQNAHCTTPTCLSCKKRIDVRPFRAPTQLTARALAHFLASQDDPYNGLCPYPLKVRPSALEIHGAHSFELLQVENKDNNSESLIPVFRSSPQPLLSHGQPQRRTSVSRQHRPEPDANGLEERVMRVNTSVNEQHQSKKDLKSLGQSLFDTVTVIYSYSKSIPNHLSVFSSLRSPHKAPANGVLDSLPVGEAVKGRHAASSNGTFTGHTNGYAKASQTNGAVTLGESAPRVSQNGTWYHRKNSLAQTPELLSNGQRLHRVRHRLQDLVPNGHLTPRTSDVSALDGALEDLPRGKPAMKSKPQSLAVHDKSRFDAAAVLTLAAGVQDHTGKMNGGIRPEIPVTSYLTCDIMDQLKEEVYDHHKELSIASSYIVDYDTDRRYQPTNPFVNRSMFYVLSDPESLLKSFRDTHNEAYEESPLPHLNSTHMIHTFQDWNRKNGALVFDSLWIAVKALFTPPPELEAQTGSHMKARKPPTTNGVSSQNLASPAASPASCRYLSDEEAAHIIMICIHALTSLVPVGWPKSWVQLRNLRSWGVVLPQAPPKSNRADDVFDPWLSIIDALEYEPALRLADRLVRGIGARNTFKRILNSLGHCDLENPDLMEILVRHLAEVERAAIANKKRLKGNLKYHEDPGWTVTATFMEWLRTIIIKKWDGKADINRGSSVGAAIDILASFYMNLDLLNLRKHMFYMPYLNERLDQTNEPTEFLKRGFYPNTFHIFFCPFLFPPHILVAHFRTINFSSMYSHYERTERAVHLQRELDPFLNEQYWRLIRSRLKVTFSDYLVLDIRREYALQDTLNQLWGHERRLFLKPLKVKMGMQEGEVGLDQGGVTYEFFRVVLSEALKPENGMFTIDPETRMTWFQPACLEADWKFEMLGLLFSLAVYNGITLPVTFPLAFYRYLLGTTPARSVHDIRDGWPTLAKSFDELLLWEDGDVSDVFMRSYCFSFEAYGRKIDVDMQAFDKQHPEAMAAWPADHEGKMETLHMGRWPLNTRRPSLDNAGWERPEPAPVASAEAMESMPTQDTPLVTNANRAKFVRDYVFWLTFRSVTNQILAFRLGFSTCISSKSLLLFDEYSFKALVEGSQDIDVKALRSATRYEEGYSATHTSIVDFWSIVEHYDMDERRKLLEFVTASDRVPITGYEAMNFVIVRHGGDTQMLPTSSTCFGKLMLPEYESKEKMRGKLNLAIQNSKGFGVV